MLDNLALLAAKIGMTEHVAENGERVLDTDPWVRGGGHGAFWTIGLGLEQERWGIATRNAGGVRPTKAAATARQSGRPIDLLLRRDNAHVFDADGQRLARTHSPPES